MNSAKEYPILFKPYLVRAIIDGLKSETRRVIKPQPIPTPDRIVRLMDNKWTPVSRSGKAGIFEPYQYECPYGMEGDIGWVRETWKPIFPYYPDYAGKRDEYRIHGVSYKADNPDMEVGLGEKFVKHDRMFEHTPRKGWHPSIHMPKWACRLKIQNTDIQTQRIQDITDDEIYAEGIEEWLKDPDNHPTDSTGKRTKYNSIRQAWRALWNDINAGPKGIKEDGEIQWYESYPFAEGDEEVSEDKYKGKPHIIFPNPFVWVVRFEKIKYWE